MQRRTALRAIAAAAAAASLPAANAQGKWPAREITLINPNAAGASTDLTARIIAQALEKRLQGTVIVKNVVGGAGALGASTLASAAPDGYTMGMAAISSHITVPAAMEVKYNAWDGFDIIGQVAELRYGIAVGEGSSIKSIDDLVAEDVQVPGDRLERLQQLLEEHESGKEQVGPEAEQVVVVEEEDRNEEGEQRHQAAEHQDQVDDCPSMPKSAKFEFI